MKKRIVSAFFTVVLSFVFCLNAFAKTTLPTPTDKFFVNDYAGVISDADEEKIYRQGVELYNKCKAQVVVVTVQSLGGEALEDYTYKLAKKWELGDKNKDNGVLLFLAVKERKVRIEVGSGLEGALPDSKTGRILDTYGVDYFKRNNFSAGLVSVYDSLINEIYIEYGIEPESGYVPVEEDVNFSAIAAFVMFMLILVFRIFLARRGVFIFPIGFGGRGGRGGFSGGGFSGGGFSGGGGGFSGGGSSRGF